MADSKKIRLPAVLITAGPTREYLDPVRFLSNPSSGKMGLALAQAAREKCPRVTLCLGPVEAAARKGIAVRRFVSAQQLLSLTVKEMHRHDILIMAAAVSDYRPARAEDKKIKKTENKMLLKLVRNPDILQAVSFIFRKKKKFLVGFAAETHDAARHARKKLEEKGLQMIICNRVFREKKGFSSDKNSVTVFVPGEKRAIASFSGSKKAVGKSLLKIILKEYGKSIGTKG
jgi:phosphopantothenoylcysteine decarboxylase / phosphopantothenate---cysteine ligase